jgi:phosphatidylglycerol---prolipoprotein diacylglyceryl transferase
MIQELFRIGSFAISPFGVMLVMAFITGYLQLRWGMRRLGAGDEEDASAIVFAAGLGGIVGAKLYYAALYRDWSLLLDRSGLVWYGGFVLGAIGVLWVMRSRRLPPWPTADAAAPALALGYAVGRIGCFLVGDDYGRPTDGPLGVVFPHGLPEVTARTMRELYHYDIPATVPDDALVAVHPTQLYETAACLLIWWIGARLVRREAAPGTAALATLALLAVERFAVEFLRAKDDRLLGGFTLAQGISLGVLLVILLLWWARSRRSGRGGRLEPRSA